MRKPFFRGMIEMAIREFSPEFTPRAKIAFVGELPSPEYLGRFTERSYAIAFAGNYSQEYVNWFKERNFNAETFTSEQLRGPEYPYQLDAVIWTEDPKKPTALLRELQAIAPNLLNHDVRVYVRLASARGLVVNTLIQDGIPLANLRQDEWQTIPENRRDRQNSFLMPCVYLIESASSWSDIATLVCDRPAGSPPKFELNLTKNFFLRNLGPMRTRNALSY